VRVFCFDCRVFAHVGQLDLGTTPLVKAGGAAVISGQAPVIR
jgi:hypothetical protein